MRRMLVVLLIGCAALAACGSSGSSSDAKAEYVDAAMKNYDSSSGSTKQFISRSQAECLSRGVVDAVGVDALKKAGITPKDFESGSSPFKSLNGQITRDQADKVAAVVTDGSCFDFTDAVIKQTEKSDPTSFGKLTKTQIRCFFDKLLSEKTVKRALADSILGDNSGANPFSSISSNQSKLLDIFDACHVKFSQLG